jgi:hypothetical protein
MIKRAALGASVAVLIAGEASAQSRTAKATVIKAGKVDRSTPSLMVGLLPRTQSMFALRAQCGQDVRAPSLHRGSASATL